MNRIRRYGVVALALVFGSTVAFAARTPKAVFDSETLRLSFYCDEVDHSGDNITIYNIGDNGTCSWGAANTATQVVFDASFCYFRTKTLGGWFSEMKKIQEFIGFENIDTSSATSMINLFRNNDSVKVIDMSAWVCTNVSSVGGAVKTGSVKTIYVAPDFAWSASVAGQNIFSYTWGLVGGAGTTWSKDKESVSYAKIDGGKDDPGMFTSKTPEYPPFVRKVVQAHCSENSVTVLIEGFRLYGGTITVQIKKGGQLVDSQVLSDFGTIDFDGLDASTTYQVLVHAENSYGTFDDNSLELTTLDPPGNRWFYDKSAGVVSNSTWRFSATVAQNTTDMTIGAVQAWPKELSELDLSPQVVDVDGVVYTIVDMNSVFGQSSGGKDPQCGFVGELILPKRIVRLSNNAFAGCTNLTIKGGIPGTLEVLGDGAFCGASSLTCDLVLTNVSLVGLLVFKDTKVASVTFGPRFESLGGNYNKGPFLNCKNLTNVTFHADSRWRAYYGANFSGCSALKELNLQGLTNMVGITGSIATGTGVTKLTFSDTLSNVTPKWFERIGGGGNVTAEKLTTVVFEGGLPDGVTFPWFFADNRVITTYVPYRKLSTKNAAGKCWLDYAADGEIKNKNTTWSSECVGVADLTKRPLLTIYPPGLKLILR